MRLFEFADAESQMELWKLITDSVWQAIAKQAQEQKQLDAKKAKSVSAAPKQSKAFKPKIVNPQASKTKKTSAQKIQSQKIQSNTHRSKPQTVLPPRSSIDSVDAKNALRTRNKKSVPYDPNSVASIQRQLDPLAFDQVSNRLNA